ncbi:alpha/beta hydrolase [Rhodococcus sp. NPDC127528]|uniref:alpha/beta hydrolase n=1 Tax=unclassified Rhodococcus (in: high G+C Gram-positive bacteria) TaxID=192944 RepID=UPI003638A671
MTELDPDVASYLSARQQYWRPMYELGVQASRSMMESMPRTPAPEMHAVEDRTLPGPHGPLSVRVYRPNDAATLPAMVYFHGGALVIGSVESFDSMARHLAAATGAMVISVDYRLAPEFPYPVASDEAYAATRWVLENAAELGTEPNLVAVAGDSAGATLAAGVALRARDEQAQSPVFQLLIYAGIDRSLEWPSVLEFADGPIVTAGDIPWSMNMYLGDDPSRDSPYAVPSLAEDLSGLPPAIVVTASHDVARDGAEDYGRRLRDAGVQTALLRYPGVAHGFLMHADAHARARLALAEIGGIARAKFALA